MTILIDSSVFFGYYNVRDVHNKKAVEIIKNFILNKYGKPVITDYIFDETVSLTMKRLDKKSGVELGKFLLNSEIFFINTNNKVFQKAWEIFQEENNLSFTDCTSIAFMLMYGIDRVATFDKEFKNTKEIKVIDS